MKQNYFKSLAIIFFVSVILSLVGCQKGAVEGSTSDSDETHVAGEGNQGIVSEQKSLTAKLTGVVLNDLGSPIENADVYVYDKGTTTNAGGIWVVEDIPVSGVDVTQELDNALFPTIPVTIVADGYTSATVSVQTRAVVSDSAHDGADGETDSSSANAPNTVIISGLVGTSGDVVLKRLVNSISGTVRNSINGLPVSMTLTLTPNRDNNYNDAKFPLDEDNDLVYGYQEKTATTDANGNFSFTKIAADTAYDISIATSGWVFKVEPTADELPGAVDLDGDDLKDVDLNEHPNGNPLTEEVYEEEDDVKTQTKWKVDIKNDEVVTLGTLYVKPVTSSDNINPYVENIANSFESSFLTKKLDNTAYYEEVKWIQLDDTVFYGGNPIEMKFSETMNTDRFDINEVNQKAGNAVSIVVFERASVPVPSWATWKCPAGPVAPKGLDADDNPDCLDRRLFVDETRTTLSGDTLSIYLKDVPKRGYIVDVLLKQTDFIDTAPEQNYLTTPPKDIETYIPNLYKSLDKILVAGDANLHTGHTGGNYWQYRMAGYFEPNLSVVYPRPQVRQITCKTSWNPDIGIIATDKSPEGAIRKLLSDLPFIGNGVLDLWEIVFGPTYKKSGLCDYFGDDVAPIGSDLVQMNADNMPMQQNQDGTVTEKTRLTTLANAYAVAQPDDFPGWDTANVVTDLAFVKLTKDVYTGFKYTLVVMRGNDSVALTAISEQQGIVMDNVGSQVDAEGNKYYLGMVGTEPAEGFYFKASGNGMQIALKGVKKGDKVVITPVENGDGESVIAKGEDNDTSRKVEDLTPPMVAIQSENFDSKLVKASDSLLGTDDVAGEILIQGETGLQYPGLQLTASLYDRTIRRAAENAVKNDVPLLAFSDGKTGLPGRPQREAHSDHVYTASNFTEWETENKEATNQFSETEREIIIEMTEQMEWGLTYEGGAFDLDQFKDKNIEDANPSDTLRAELTGLRSYDSGNAFLVAKLHDWREVKDKSLMTIMGLSDLNNNQVVSNDAGVFFLDRTPPMAKSVNFRVEGNNVVLDVDFDQDLYWDWNVGETMEIMNSDESVKYTVTFGKDTPHTIKGIDYTDAKGRDISKSDEISVKIEGNNTKTLTLTIEGNDDGLVTVGDQKINLKSYFDVLSTGAHISWPGIGDYINNRWKTVTAKANETGATAAEQNDAYYCPSAGNCKDPAIVVDDKFKPTLKYKSDLELNCAGYTELVADDESSSKDVKFTCLSITDNKAAINDDGKEYEPDQSSLKVHLIHTVDDEKNQINHWSEPRNFGGGITENLANITMTAEEIADGDVTQDDVNGAWRTIYKNRNRDHIWSMYDDGRDITIDNEKVDRGSESYEIEMSFREPIKCKNDDNQDVTVPNDPCKNIDAGIYSDENLATKISSGDVDTTTYSGVVAKYVDSSTIRISFTLREDKQAAKDHTLALIGIEDKSGQKAGETVGDDDNVVRITLLDGDKGVKIQPATMVY